MEQVWDNVQYVTLICHAHQLLFFSLCLNFHLWSCDKRSVLRLVMLQKKWGSGIHSLLPNNFSWNFKTLLNSTKYVMFQKIAAAHRQPIMVGFSGVMYADTEEEAGVCYDHLIALLLKFKYVSFTSTSKVGVSGVVTGAVNLERCPNCVDTTRTTTQKPTYESSRTLVSTESSSTMLCLWCMQSLPPWRISTEIGYWTLHATETDIISTSCGVCWEKPST